LARAIAHATGRKHIELDTLYWGPNWTQDIHFQAKVVAAAAGEEWVMDGNYGSVREHTWPRATALVWLNYSLPLTLWRVAARTVRRRMSREILFGGNRESLRSAFFTRDGLFWYAVRSYPRYRREYPLLFREPRFRHLSVVELKSPADADRMLQDGEDSFRRRPA
jgi:adenylate kinase family enzyme